MNTSIRRIIILLIMFLIMLTVVSLGAKLNIHQVEITFADGTTLPVTVKGEKQANSILLDNNIPLLEEEKVTDITENGVRKLKISKKDNIKESVQVEKISQIINSTTDNNLYEKIEVERVEIPFKTITKESDSENGKSIVVKIGEKGIKEIKYRSLYKNEKLLEKKEISSKVIKEPVDKVVQLAPKVTSRNIRTGTTKQYSQSEIDLLCAITAQECSSSYEGALAVITTACNRAESSKWRKNGSDPLSQYKAKGQFTYSIDGRYTNRLNGNYGAHVRKAVEDALNGKRNHKFLSFRSAWTGVSGVNIGGNVYFNHM